MLHREALRRTEGGHGPQRSGGPPLATLCRCSLLCRLLQLRLMVIAETHRNRPDDLLLAVVSGDAGVAVVVFQSRQRYRGGPLVSQVLWH